MASSDNPHTPYEHNSEQPPSIAVIEAIAALEEVKPTDLEFILFDYIHPEALDKVIQSGDVAVTFTVAQY